MILSFNNFSSCHCLKILIYSFIFIPMLFFKKIPITSYAADSFQPDIFMEQGLKSFKFGHFEEAVLYFTQAEKTYDKTNVPQKKYKALVELARAYQSLGHYWKSLEILDKALSYKYLILDQTQTAHIYAIMGNAYLYTGAENAAEKSLKKGLTIAQEKKNSFIAASILNNMGNMYTMRNQYTKAMDSYKEGLYLLNEKDDLLLVALIYSNIAKLSFKEGKYNDTISVLESAYEKYFELGDSHNKAIGLINIAQTSRKLSEKISNSTPNLRLYASKALLKAIHISETITDHRALSYALGYLGQIHEEDKHYDDALSRTRRAVFEAQHVNSLESLYLWQWQIGRIFHAQGKILDAISAYKNAVDTLQDIRHELYDHCEMINRISFRKTVEPIYFGLADLLLQHAASLNEQEQQKSFLIKAREIIELLKMAELRDYFQDPCLGEYLNKIKSIDAISDKTAVLYIIPLNNRIELLLSFKGEIKRTSIQVSSSSIDKQTRLFRKELEKRTTREYLEHAQILYDWIIRPLEEKLISNRIETLVFIPDGVLRSIPMCALHDGEQFLIRKFAITNAPGLYLTDPHPIKRENTSILLAGLTESVQGFPALTYVDWEIHSIHELYGGTLFLNKDLLISNIKHTLKMKPYSIVHFASHGKFMGNIQESYLLTWDDKMAMDQLDHFLKPSQYRKNPVELLILSACQTAAGDDRAALGLAGIAIKAGARSALATLWHIDDRASSELILEFYNQFQNLSLSKAKALQMAQLKLIDDPRYKHPCYWSPFLMIGNWL